jgi:hypothetical protein
MDGDLVRRHGRSGHTERNVLSQLGSRRVIKILGGS